MELQKLYEALLAEGCNQFYIDGIGGPQSDDVDCLGFHNGKWEVYYTERGQKDSPFFSSTDQAEAIRFYYGHIMKIDHWHLVAFTRSAAIVDSYEKQLEQANIKTIRNDIFR